MAGGRVRIFEAASGARLGRARRPSPHGLGAHYALSAVWLGTGVGYVVALAIEADDEHWAPVTIADGLVGSEFRSVAAFRGAVADALAEAAVAKLVGAAKKLNGRVGVVRSQSGLHGAEMLVAKGEDVRPHRVHH